MGHYQEFNELFVILEEFQSLVCPLYKSLCSPQFVQDITQGTESIVSNGQPLMTYSKGLIGAFRRQYKTWQCCL